MADTSALTAADLPGLLKFDAFLEKAPHFDKYVFVGHWPVVLYSDTVSCADPIIDQKRHVVSLDGGCGVKDGAQLNAVLVAPDGSFSHESYDGCRRYRRSTRRRTAATPSTSAGPSDLSSGSRPKTA